MKVDNLTMSNEADELADQVLALPESVRAFMAHKLIGSLDDVIDDNADAEWALEIEKRSKQIEKAEVTCRPVDEAIKDIRAKLNNNYVIRSAC